MTDYVPVLVALIAGPLAVLVTAYLSRPKIKTDATKTLTDISLSLVEPQRARIAHLEAKIVELEESYGSRLGILEAENKVLHRWSHVLVAQVIEAGGVPADLDTIRLLEGGQG